MTARWAIVLGGGALVGVSVLAVPCAAQVPTAPGAAAAQSQAAQAPAVGPQLPALPGAGPVLPAPGPVAVPGTSSGPGVTQLPSGSSGRLSPSAGRGLPGMPGGPPVNAPMGAGDPSARYMRPLVVGPLSCDLLLDPACL